jgi:hypothetical protein
LVSGFTFDLGLNHRSPRSRSVFIAFGLEALWLFSPLILRNISISYWPAFNHLAHWLAEWAGASSPTEVAYRLFYTVITTGGAKSSEVEIVAWMMGLQLAFGLVLAFVASWQLRPIFRRQDAGGSNRAIQQLFHTRKSRMRHATGASGSIRLSRDPEPSESLHARWLFQLRLPLRNRPMLWKELYTERARGLAELVGLLLTITAGGFLAYYTYCAASAGNGETPRPSCRILGRSFSDAKAP